MSRGQTHAVAEADPEATRRLVEGKANVVADALSRRRTSRETIATTRTSQFRLLEEATVMMIRESPAGTPSVDSTNTSNVSRFYCAQVRAEPEILQRIVDFQKTDQDYVVYQGLASSVDHPDWSSIRSGGVIRFRNRLWIPAQEQLRRELLQEAHRSFYSIHPGNTKMYRDMRRIYWWPGMKIDIGAFVMKCDICQQVKAEHRKPGGLLHSLPIPEWKWEHISMDFVSGLPLTQRKHDAIWVVVDRLTKSAHFLPVSMKYPMNQLCELYVREILRFHGVPVSITSDRDPRFTSRLWQGLQKQLGTTLNLSTAYHPQTDGQTERLILVLEDMLRACVLEFGGSWEKYIPLCEFSYNNSYQASIGMAPFEALYGRPCRSQRVGRR
ncbi:hypothetical protein Sjap_005481 [Stephania japonica]|uniref:Integrase catalytic domain-containing protein n=1 Tax=Stephania japonica TaxID=461633 RepID=A0AAP0K5P0_9MAGN